jgi:D-beta-D-heptose 7-phosphate kinase/D-beta-D-heptose 1-phosphate adenosyltransferase
MMARRIGGTVMTTGAAVAMAARRRRAGRKVVFTNGCFDLLHAGHVELLDRARRLGDCLVVGVNSNRSVRVLKGRGRPIVPLAERMELLAGLRMVDCVVSFGAPTPARLIARLRPDVLVKGGDYRAEDIVGYDTVTASGGKVVTVPLRRGQSTSRLIGRAVAWSSRRSPLRRRTKAKR